MASSEQKNQTSATSIRAALTRRASEGQAWLFASLFFLLIAPPAKSDLDPGLTKPYQLSVVLQFSDHRALTKYFQEHTSNQLRSLLQQSFGKLAEINVLRKHALIKDIDRSGLQKTLGGWDNLTGTRTHFLFINFSDGAYHVRSMWHDGDTGVPAPKVQISNIRDRWLVARRLAQLIVREFVLTGTIARADGGDLELLLRGGELGVPLDRWLKTGAIFAVCRIPEGGGKARAERLAWGLLRVKDPPVNGRCRCEYFHRYQGEALTFSPGIAGYRCMQLPAIRTPMALQVFDDKTDRPAENLQVHVAADGFGAAQEQLNTDSQGRVQTAKRYSGVAFVRIVSGATPLAQFPVALVDRRPIVCRINPDPKSVARSQFELRYHRWLRRLYEDLYLAGDRVTILNKRLKKSPGAALSFARDGLRTFLSEMQNLRREQVDLSDSATAGKIALNMDEGEKLLGDLEKRKHELLQFIARLEKVLREEKSEERKKLRGMVERAGLLEKEADYPQAIALYKQILGLSPGQSKIHAHLKKLQDSWKAKNSKHNAARVFIYTDWPKTANSPQLKPLIEKAKAALKTCRNAGDRLSPRRMLQANLAHAVHLQKRLEALRGSGGGQDRQLELKEISRLGEELRLLHEAVQKWVQSD